MFKHFHIHLFAWAALLLAACQSAPEAAAPPEKTAADSDLIELNKAQLSNTGITWGPMEQKPATERLPVTGEFRVHNQDIATISSPAQGILTATYTELNQPVKKGARLADLRLPELMDWQQEFLETKERRVFLQQEFDRFKALKDDNATALKNFQKAEAELREADTRLGLLSAKLKLYDVIPEQLKAAEANGLYKVKAPVNGVVTKTWVNAGVAVQPGTPLCEIVNIDRMHAELFVFEKDMDKVRTGQQALIKLGDKTVEAKIFSIDPVLDPERKAMRAHARLTQKTDRQLINGAYLEADILLSADQALTDALPAEAVVRENEGSFIFVLAAQDGQRYHFRKIPVDTRPADNGYVAVRVKAPLPPGANIVKKGAYYVSAQGAGIEIEE